MALSDFVQDDGTEEAHRVRKALRLLELDPRMSDVLPLVDQLPGILDVVQQLGVVQVGGQLGAQKASDVGEILSAISNAWTTANGEAATA